MKWHLACGEVGSRLLPRRSVMERTEGWSNQEFRFLSEIGFPDVLCQQGPIKESVMGTMDWWEVL